MARPTSLIAALAAMVPKVMICATFSRPYFCVTYSISSPRRRAASRPDRNSLRPRVVNEVPNDQKISFVPHFLNHLDFAGQPAFIFAERIRQRARLRQALQVRNARPKSL